MINETHHPVTTIASCYTSVTHSPECCSFCDVFRHFVTIVMTHGTPKIFTNTCGSVGSVAYINVAAEFEPLWLTQSLLVLLLRDSTRLWVVIHGVPTRQSHRAFLDDRVCCVQARARVHGVECGNFQSSLLRADVPCSDWRVRCDWQERVNGRRQAEASEGDPRVRHRAAYVDLQASHTHQAKSVPFSCFFCRFFSVKECDRLALVTYDTKVEMKFRLTNMTKENKQKTTKKVKELTDGSSTNLCGGLIKGRSTPILSHELAF